jgi:hypothetical protein
MKKNVGMDYIILSSYSRMIKPKIFILHWNGFKFSSKPCSVEVWKIKVNPEEKPHNGKRFGIYPANLSGITFRFLGIEGFSHIIEDTTASRKRSERLSSEKSLGTY